MTRESARDKSARRDSEQTSRESKTKVEFTKDNVVQGYDAAGNPINTDTREDLSSAGVGGNQLEPRSRRK